jgi:hypothetical protein
MPQRKEKKHRNLNNKSSSLRYAAADLQRSVQLLQLFLGFECFAVLYCNAATQEKESARLEQQEF